jgi:hypothetical protein
MDMRREMPCLQRGALCLLRAAIARYPGLAVRSPNFRVGGLLARFLNRGNRSGALQFAEAPLVPRSGSRFPANGMGMRSCRFAASAEAPGKLRFTEASPRWHIRC